MNMVNGELSIDILSPPSRITKPQRGRSLTRNLLNASMTMKLKSKQSLEIDDLSSCGDWDSTHDEPAIPFEQLKQIAQEFECGVKLHEKKHALRHRKSEFHFIGSDAVSFLLDKGYGTSRRNALTIGRSLACELALFEHVSKDVELQDKPDAHYKFLPLNKREVHPLSPEATLHTGQYNIDYISDVFEEGVEVGPNVFHYRTYKDTFVGRDAVSFLLQHRLAKTRQDAVRVGNLLFDRGLFHHVCDDHVFKDKFLFYRFIPPEKRVKVSPSVTLPVESLAARFRELVKPSSDPHHPFRNTFCGSAAVEALISGRLASSRFEAVQIGQKLAEELQLFYCVYDSDRPFLDNAHTYYRYYNHDTRGLGWLKKKDSDRGTELMSNDDELSNAGSLDDGDIFGKVEDFDDGRENKCFHRENLYGEKNNEQGSDLPPLIKMSAFNQSMRRMEEDEDDFSSSGLGSINTDKTSVVDALLFEDSTRYFDKYGFAIDSSAENEAEIQPSEGVLQKKYVGCDLNEAEWEALLDECSSAQPGTVPKASLTKMKHAMRLGLADCHRQRTWTLITGVDIFLPEKLGEYQKLVKQGFKSRSNSIAGVNNNNRTQTLRGIIERDLHRTFPKHILFSDDAAGDDDVEQVKISCSSSFLSEEFSAEDTTEVGSCQLSSSITSETMNSQKLNGSTGPAALRRILYAYSVYDPEVGYCQGMNFIAAMFLLFLPEEESFWMLVAVMNEEPYCMRSMFLENMAGTHKALYIADKLIKKYLPKLARHFQRDNIEVSMFATQWIMTVFTSTFNFELVTRVWDAFLVEGWKVVYRVIISLLNQAQSELLELNMEEIFDYFRDFSTRIDGHAVILASLNIPMKNKLIRKYGEEWERLQYGPALTRRNSTESNCSASRTSLNAPIIQKKRTTKKIVPSFVQNKLPFMG